LTFLLLFLSDADDPHTLLILAEEELVAVDLLTVGWPCYELPYLSSIHASAILSATHVANVPQALWDRIKHAGENQRTKCSARVSIIIVIFYFEKYIVRNNNKTKPNRQTKNPRIITAGCL